MKIQEPSSSFASSSKLIALQLVHPLKGSATGSVQPTKIRITYNKTINLVIFNYKSTQHPTNKKPSVLIEGEIST